MKICESCKRYLETHGICNNSNSEKLAVFPHESCEKWEAKEENNELAIILHKRRCYIFTSDYIVVGTDHIILFFTHNDKGY